MESQKQVGEYVPDMSVPTRFMRPELSRRLRVFMRVGTGLIIGIWLWQVLSGQHDWGFAFAISYFVVVTLFVLWLNLRADEMDVSVRVAFFQLLRFRRLKKASQRREGNG